MAAKSTTPKTKKPKPEFTFRQFFLDDDDTGGNYLMIKQNNKLIHLYLHLKNFQKRFIGTVTKSTRTLTTRRIRSKHLFQKLNAYGFNYHVLSRQSSFDFINLSDDLGNHWKLPVKYVLESGKDANEFLHFKQQGFELQKFVSLENLEQFRVKPEENRRF